MDELPNVNLDSFSLKDSTSQPIGLQPSGAKFLIETPKSHTASPPNEVEDAEENENDEERDNSGTESPVHTLKQIKLLPELFSLFTELLRGELLVREFGNSAGSIRLKLGKMRDIIGSIDGIDESLRHRQRKIEGLKKGIQRKKAFLDDFKAMVNSNIDLS